MIGVPRWLNTKEDVLVCLKYAQDGVLDKNVLLKRIKDLLSDAKVWTYEKDVDNTYNPASDEKVMEEKQMDSSGNEVTKYICYKLIDNPNARFKRMGFTEAELNQIITELEG